MFLFCVVLACSMKQPNIKTSLPENWNPYPADTQTHSVLASNTRAKSCSYISNFSIFSIYITVQSHSPSLHKVPQTATIDPTQEEHSNPDTGFQHPLRAHVEAVMSRGELKDGDTVKATKLGADVPWLSVWDENTWNHTKLLQLLTQGGPHHSTGSSGPSRTLPCAWRHKPCSEEASGVSGAGCEAFPASSFPQVFHNPIPKKNILKTHPLHWTVHLQEHQLLFKHLLICHLNRKKVHFSQCLLFWIIYQQLIMLPYIVVL